MATYVLLESAEQQHQVHVVVHTAVPTTKNAVGIKWRDVVVAWVEDTTSVVPSSILPPGIQADLDSGALYEWRGLIRFNANLSDANKLVVIDNWVAINDSFEFDLMKSKLEFYGMAGSV